MCRPARWRSFGASASPRQCETPGSPNIIQMTSPSAPRQPGLSWRASRSRRAASDTQQPGARTPGGPRLSRPTGSIRSISSRCFWPMLHRSRAFVFCTAAGSRIWSRTTPELSPRSVTSIPATRFPSVAPIWSVATAAGRPCGKGSALRSPVRRSSSGCNPPIFAPQHCSRFFPGAGLALSGPQSAALRGRVCDRRPRDMARAQSSS
jgi:hypothetical protein